MFPYIYPDFFISHSERRISSSPSTKKQEENIYFFICNEKKSYKDFILPCSEIKFTILNYKNMSFLKNQNIAHKQCFSKDAR